MSDGGTTDSLISLSEATVHFVRDNGLFSHTDCERGWIEAVGVSTDWAVLDEVLTTPRKPPYSRLERLAVLLVTFIRSFLRCLRRPSSRVRPLSVPPGEIGQSVGARGFAASRPHTRTLPVLGTQSAGEGVAAAGGTERGESLDEGNRRKHAQRGSRVQRLGAFAVFSVVAVARRYRVVETTALRAAFDKNLESPATTSTQFGNSDPSKSRSSTSISWPSWSFVNA
ncbi:hypothetical protein SAMN04487948_102161 [Halogranum amylolyticum]|uniref:Uncharacterized protein n=1 Tax=Halogranum amylolyticum TaxID=660520 RepID=A0A1H8P9V9_9EURY|nr:hypothetical protein SAMN04487948_102161 [Halogranum amylolyticum]